MGALKSLNSFERIKSGKPLDSKDSTGGGAEGSDTDISCLFMYSLASFKVVVEDWEISSDSVEK